MFATIAICTFNRARLLDNTLGQLRQLDTSGCGDWDIMVVNNNCADDTDTVIQSHSEHLPVRRLWEPRPGKSHAANLAVQEAKGELILWIDDDVLVDRAWLKAYVEAARAHPRVSFFGGPIIPSFETEPPAWLINHFPLISNCFATRTGFEEPYTSISPGYLPCGANMATRRDCFEDSSFDIRLGPVETTNFQHEETGLLQTCLDRGLRGLWVKEAGVRHFTPKERLTERYVWRFHWCAGRTHVRRGVLTGSKELFGVPRWALRAYVENLVASKLLAPTKNERWIRSLKTAAFCRGVIEEYRKQNSSGQVGSRQSSQRNEAALCA